MKTYLFYLFITLLSVFFLMLYSNIKSGDYKMKLSPKTALLSLSFLSLFIPIIIRDVSVGADYITYQNTFNSIISSNYLSSETVSWLGLPFIYLLKFIAPICLNSYVLFYGIISFATLVFLYLSILKSKIPWLSLMLFIGFCLYFQMFNQMRQLLAISMILYSFKYIDGRNIIKFLLLIISASVIHMTAIIFLPVYFISKLKINRRNLTIYASIGVLSALYFNEIMKLVALTPYGSTYLDSGYNTQFSSSTIMNFLVRLTMLIGVLSLAKKTIKENLNATYLYNLVIICTILQVMTMYSALFGRITTMFFIFYILLIPAVITANFKKELARRATFAVVIALLTYQSVYYLSPNGASSGGYDTYKVMPTGRQE